MLSFLTLPNLFTNKIIQLSIKKNAVQKTASVTSGRFPWERLWLYSIGHLFTKACLLAEFHSHNRGKCPSIPQLTALSLFVFSSVQWWCDRPQLCYLGCSQCWMTADYMKKHRSPPSSVTQKCPPYPDLNVQLWYMNCSRFCISSEHLMSVGWTVAMFTLLQKDNNFVKRSVIN